MVFWTALTSLPLKAPPNWIRPWSFCNREEARRWFQQEDRKSLTRPKWSVN